MAGFILMAGCSTPVQERKVSKSGFLKNYSQLKSGKDGEVQLLYINPRANFAKYQKVMLEPVQMRVKEDSKLAKVPKAEKKELVNYLATTLREQLKSDYIFVSKPGPDVMRLRVAITDGKKGKVVMNTVSTIIPISLAVDLVKYAATGTHMAVGEASIEAEGLNSASGVRLFAAVDARSGRKSLMSGNFTKWGDVEDAYNYCAKQLHIRLAELSTK
ncbi:DUF3313 domain-containing protein [Pontiella sulfatireligans]|uniref:DUF3313 domain-containing protein n=1 Tax=Pontiella sulfatireligans TaxID=2750658 RepID=A0A6C2UQN0_9BACT|nr:DUF3313 domain-containing protein [Pontiella sulfatireligans]VGO22518.1 hypothetical protein SCARR_04602 [Pontiella sulfatireligans]